MATTAGRWSLGCVCCAILALALTGSRRPSPRESLPLQPADLLPGRRPIETGPVQRFEPPVRPAEGRLAVRHFGPPHPARAAARIGEETWVETPGGLLRFGDDLWRTPSRARPVAETVGGALDRPAECRRLKCTAVQRCGGQLYVATNDRGLLLAGKGDARSVRGLEGSRVAGLSACRETDDGVELLAASTRGLFRVRGLDATRIAGSPLHVTAAIYYGDDLLVGSFDDGLTLLRGGMRRAVPVPGRVSLLLAGPANAVLVGTDRGLFVWRPGRRPAEVPLQGPPSSTVTALALDGDALWVGTFDGGLARLRGEVWTTVPVLDDRITGLHVDQAGALWVGTASGLGRLRDGKVRRVPDRRGWLARHVASLRGSGSPTDPTLWAAVYPGLVAVDTSLDPPELHYFGARGQEADAGLPGPTIYAVAPGPEGLWVGSDDGLGRLSRSGTRALTDLGGVLPDNWINDVRTDGESLLVLTLRSGLLHLAPSGSRVFESRLMTSPGVLLAHGGRVLFGTNSSGLVILDEGGAPVFRSFGPKQGLHSSMVTSLLLDAPRDRLWVGGSAGLTRIDRASRSLRLQPAAVATADRKENAP